MRLLMTLVRSNSYVLEYQYKHFRSIWMHCRYLLFLRERENKRCHNLIQKVFHLKSSYEQHENAHKNHKYSILLIVYFDPPPPRYCWFSPVYYDCISLWQEIIRRPYSTAIQPHPLPVRWRTVWLTAALDIRHSPSPSLPGHLAGRRVSGQAYCSWYTSRTGHAHWAFPVSPWSCRWTFSAILQNGDRWCHTNTIKILNTQQFNFKDRWVL